MRLKNTFTKTIALLMCAGVLMGGCTDRSGTLQVLEDQGYTEVQVKGHSWFGCSDSDTFKTRFTAVNDKGNKVKGEVCSGITKGKTVRFK